MNHSNAPSNDRASIYCASGWGALWIFVAVMCVIVLVGCGGSGGDQQGTTVINNQPQECAECKR